MATDGDSERLREDMARVRAKRRSRLHDLNQKTARLTDWREHVKGAPYAAFALSAVVGFTVASRVFAAKHSADDKPLDHQPRSKLSVTRSVAADLLSFAAPLVASAVRRYATQQILAPRGSSYDERRSHTRLVAKPR